MLAVWEVLLQCKFQHNLQQREQIEEYPEREEEDLQILATSNRLQRHLRHLATMRESNYRNGLVAKQELQRSGHPDLVHLRVEDLTARISQIVRVDRTALDMHIGVGVDGNIDVECEADPYAALHASSSREAEYVSYSGAEPSSDIKARCSL